MATKILNWALQIAYKYIDNFVEPIEGKQIDLGGLLKGNISIKHVQIKQGVLDVLPLPINLQFNYIGEVTVSIPLWSWLTRSVKVTVEDVVFVVSTRAFLDWDAEAFMEAQRAAKIMSLAANESACLVNNIEDGVLWRLGMKIGGGAVVEVRNVHVRFEDWYSCRDNAFALGAQIGSLSVTDVPKLSSRNIGRNLGHNLGKIGKMGKGGDLGSADAETANIYKNVSNEAYSDVNIIRKQISIRECGVYCDSLRFPEDRGSSANERNDYSGAGLRNEVHDGEKEKEKERRGGATGEGEEEGNEDESSPMRGRMISLVPAHRIKGLAMKDGVVYVPQGRGDGPSGRGGPFEMSQTKNKSDGAGGRDWGKAGSGGRGRGTGSGGRDSEGDGGGTNGGGDAKTQGIMASVFGWIVAKTVGNGSGGGHECAEKGLEMGSGGDGGTGGLTSMNPDHDGSGPPNVSALKMAKGVDPNVVLGLGLNRGVVTPSPLPGSPGVQRPTDGGGGAGGRGGVAGFGGIVQTAEHYKIDGRWAYRDLFRNFSAVRLYDVDRKQWYDAEELVSLAQTPASRLLQRDEDSAAKEIESRRLDRLLFLHQEKLIRNARETRIDKSNLPPETLPLGDPNRTPDPSEFDHEDGGGGGGKSDAYFRQSRDRSGRDRAGGRDVRGDVGRDGGRHGGGDGGRDGGKGLKGVKKEILPLPSLKIRPQFLEQTVETVRLLRDSYHDFILAPQDLGVELSLTLLPVAAKRVRAPRTGRRDSELPLMARWARQLGLNRPGKAVTGEDDVEAKYTPLPTYMPQLPTTNTRGHLEHMIDEAADELLRDIGAKKVFASANPSSSAARANVAGGLEAEDEPSILPMARVDLNLASLRVCISPPQISQLLAWAEVYGNLFPTWSTAQIAKTELARPSFRDAQLYIDAWIVKLFCMQGSVVPDPYAGRPDGHGPSSGPSSEPRSQRSAGGREGAEVEQAVEGAPVIEWPDHVNKAQRKVIEWCYNFELTYNSNTIVALRKEALASWRFDPKSRPAWRDHGAEKSISFTKTSGDKANPPRRNFFFRRAIEEETALTQMLSVDEQGGALQPLKGVGLTTDDPANETDSKVGTYNSGGLGLGGPGFGTEDLFEAMDGAMERVAPGGSAQSDLVQLISNIVSQLDQDAENSKLKRYFFQTDVLINLHLFDFQLCIPLADRVDDRQPSTGGLLSTQSSSSPTMSKRIGSFSPQRGSARSPGGEGRVGDFEEEAPTGHDVVVALERMDLFLTTASNTPSGHMDLKLSLGALSVLALTGFLPRLAPVMIADVEQNERALKRAQALQRNRRLLLQALAQARMLPEEEVKRFTGSLGARWRRGRRRYRGAGGRLSLLKTQFTCDFIFMIAAPPAPRSLRADSGAARLKRGVSRATRVRNFLDAATGPREKISPALEHSRADERRDGVSTLRNPGGRESTGNEPDPSSAKTRVLSGSGRDGDEGVVVGGVSVLSVYGSRDLPFSPALTMQMQMWPYRVPELLDMKLEAEIPGDIIMLAATEPLIKLLGDFLPVIDALAYKDLFTFHEICKQFDVKGAREYSAECLVGDLPHTSMDMSFKLGGCLHVVIPSSQGESDCVNLAAEGYHLQLGSVKFETVKVSPRQRRAVALRQPLSRQLDVFEARVDLLQATREASCTEALQRACRKEIYLGAGERLPIEAVVARYARQALNAGLLRPNQLLQLQQLHQLQQPQKPQQYQRPGAETAAPSYLLYPIVLKPVKIALTHLPLRKDVPSVHVDLQLERCALEVNSYDIVLFSHIAAVAMAAMEPIQGALDATLMRLSDSAAQVEYLIETTPCPSRAIKPRARHQKNIRPFLDEEELDRELSLILDDSSVLDIIEANRKKSDSSLFSGQELSPFSNVVGALCPPLSRIGREGRRSNGAKIRDSSSSDEELSSDIELGSSPLLSSQESLPLEPRQSRSPLSTSFSGSSRSRSLTTRTPSLRGFRKKRSMSLSGLMGRGSSASPVSPRSGSTALSRSSRSSGSRLSRTSESLSSSDSDADTGSQSLSLQDFLSGSLRSPRRRQTKRFSRKGGKGGGESARNEGDETYSETDSDALEDDRSGNTSWSGSEPRGPKAKTGGRIRRGKAGKRAKGGKEGNRRTNDAIFHRNSSDRLLGKWDRLSKYVDYSMDEMAEKALLGRTPQSRSPQGYGGSVGRVSGSQSICSRSTADTENALGGWRGLEESTAAITALHVSVTSLSVLVCGIDPARAPVTLPERNIHKSYSWKPKSSFTPVHFAYNIYQPTVPLLSLHVGRLTANVDLVSDGAMNVDLGVASLRINDETSLLPIAASAIYCISEHIQPINATENLQHLALRHFKETHRVVKEGERARRASGENTMGRSASSGVTFTKLQLRGNLSSSQEDRRHPPGMNLMSMGSHSSDLESYVSRTTKERKREDREDRKALFYRDSISPSNSLSESSSESNSELALGSRASSSESKSMDRYDMAPYLPNGSSDELGHGTRDRESDVDDTRGFGGSGQNVRKRESSPGDLQKREAGAVPPTDGYLDPYSSDVASFNGGLSRAFSGLIDDEEYNYPACNFALEGRQKRLENFQHIKVKLTGNLTTMEDVQLDVRFTPIRLTLPLEFADEVSNFASELSLLMPAAGGQAGGAVEAGGSGGLGGPGSRLHGDLHDDGAGGAAGDGLARPPAPTTAFQASLIRSLEEGPQRRQLTDLQPVDALNKHQDRLASRADITIKLDCVEVLIPVEPLRLAAVGEAKRATFVEDQTETASPARDVARPRPTLQSGRDSGAQRTPRAGREASDESRSLSDSGPLSPYAKASPDLLPDDESELAADDISDSEIDTSAEETGQPSQEEMTVAEPKRGAAGGRRQTNRAGGVKWAASTGQGGKETSFQTRSLLRIDERDLLERVCEKWQTVIRNEMRNNHFGTRISSLSTSRFPMCLAIRFALQIGLKLEQPLALAAQTLPPAARRLHMSSDPVNLYKYPFSASSMQRMYSLEQSDTRSRTQQSQSQLGSVSLQSLQRSDSARTARPPKGFPGEGRDDGERGAVSRRKGRREDSRAKSKSTSRTKSRSKARQGGRSLSAADGSEESEDLDDLDAFREQRKKRYEPSASRKLFRFKRALAEYRWVERCVRSPVAPNASVRTFFPGRVNLALGLTHVTLDFVRPATPAILKIPRIVWHSAARAANALPTSISLAATGSSNPNPTGGTLAGGTLAGVTSNIGGGVGSPLLGSPQAMAGEAIPASALSSQPLIEPFNLELFVDLMLPSERAAWERYYGFSQAEAAEARKLFGIRGREDDEYVIVNVTVSALTVALTPNKITELLKLSALGGDFAAQEAERAERNAVFFECVERQRAQALQDELEGFLGPTSQSSYPGLSSEAGQGVVLNRTRGNHTPSRTPPHVHNSQDQNQNHMNSGGHGPKHFSDHGGGEGGGDSPQSSSPASIASDLGLDLGLGGASVATPLNTGPTPAQRRAKNALGLNREWKENEVDFLDWLFDVGLPPTLSPGLFVFNLMTSWTESNVSLVCERIRVIVWDEDVKPEEVAGAVQQPGGAGGMGPTTPGVLLGSVASPGPTLTAAGMNMRQVAGTSLQAPSDFSFHSREKRLRFIDLQITNTDISATQMAVSCLTHPPWWWVEINPLEQVVEGTEVIALSFISYDFEPLRQNPYRHRPRPHLGLYYKMRNLVKSGYAAYQARRARNAPAALDDRDGTFRGSVAEIESKMRSAIPFLQLRGNLELSCSHDVAQLDGLGMSAEGRSKHIHNVQNGSSGESVEDGSGDCEGSGENASIYILEPCQIKFIGGKRVPNYILQITTEVSWINLTIGLFLLENLLKLAAELITNTVPKAITELHLPAYARYVSKQSTSAHYALFTVRSSSLTNKNGTGQFAVPLFIQALIPSRASKARAKICGKARPLQPCYNRVTIAASRLSLRPVGAWEPHHALYQSLKAFTQILGSGFTEKARANRKKVISAFPCLPAAVKTEQQAVRDLVGAMARKMLGASAPERLTESVRKPPLVFENLLGQTVAFWSKANKTWVLVENGASVEIPVVYDHLTALVQPEPFCVRLRLLNNVYDLRSVAELRELSLFARGSLTSTSQSPFGGASGTSAAAAPRHALHTFRILTTTRGASSGPHRKPSPASDAGAGNRRYPQGGPPQGGAPQGGAPQGSEPGKPPTVATPAVLSPSSAGIPRRRSRSRRSHSLSGARSDAQLSGTHSSRRLRRKQGHGSGSAKRSYISGRGRKRGRSGLRTKGSGTPPGAVAVRTSLRPFLASSEVRRSVPMMARIFAEKARIVIGSTLKKGSVIKGDFAYRLVLSSPFIFRNFSSEEMVVFSVPPNALADPGTSTAMAAFPGEPVGFPVEKILRSAAIEETAAAAGTEQAARYAQLLKPVPGTSAAQWLQTRQAKTVMFALPPPPPPINVPPQPWLPYAEVAPGPSIVTAHAALSTPSRGLGMGVSDGIGGVGGGGGGAAGGGGGGGGVRSTPFSAARARVKGTIAADSTTFPEEPAQTIQTVFVATQLHGPEALADYALLEHRLTRPTSLSPPLEAEQAANRPPRENMSRYSSLQGASSARGDARPSLPASHQGDHVSLVVDQQGETSEEAAIARLRRLCVQLPPLEGLNCLVLPPCEETVPGGGGLRGPTVGNGDGGLPMGGHASVEVAPGGPSRGPHFATSSTRWPSKWPRPVPLHWLLPEQSLILSGLSGSSRLQIVSELSKVSFGSIRNFRTFAPGQGRSQPSAPLTPPIPAIATSQPSAMLEVMAGKEPSQSSQAPSMAAIGSEGRSEGRSEGKEMDPNVATNEESPLVITAGGNLGALLTAEAARSQRAAQGAINQENVVNPTMRDYQMLGTSLSSLGVFYSARDLRSMIAAVPDIAGKANDVQAAERALRRLDPPARVLRVSLRHERPTALQQTLNPFTAGQASMPMQLPTQTPLSLGTPTIGIPSASGVGQWPPERAQSILLAALTGALAADAPEIRSYSLSTSLILPSARRTVGKVAAYEGVISPLLEISNRLPRPLVVSSLRPNSVRTQRLLRAQLRNAAASTTTSIDDDNSPLYGLPPHSQPPRTAPPQAQIMQSQLMPPSQLQLPGAESPMHVAESAQGPKFYIPTGSSLYASLSETGLHFAFGRLSTIGAVNFSLDVNERAGPVEVVLSRRRPPPKAGFGGAFSALGRSGGGGLFGGRDTSASAGGMGPGTGVSNGPGSGPGLTGNGSIASEFDDGRGEGRESVFDEGGLSVSGSQIHAANVKYAMDQSVRLYAETTACWSLYENSGANALGLGAMSDSVRLFGKSYMRTITVFSDTWIINRLDYPLELKGKQNIHLPPHRRVVASVDLSKAAKSLKLAFQKNELPNVPGSKFFDALASPATSRKVVTSSGFLTSRSFAFSTSLSLPNAIDFPASDIFPSLSLIAFSSRAASPFLRTSTLELLPAYVIANDRDEAMYIREVPSKKNNFGEAFLTVPPNGRIEFHPQNKKKNGQINVQISALPEVERYHAVMTAAVIAGVKSFDPDSVSGDSPLWSAAFAVNSARLTQIRHPTIATPAVSVGAFDLTDVSVTIKNGVRLISLIKTQVPDFRLVNNSDHCIAVAQHEFDGPFEVLKPSLSLHKKIRDDLDLARLQPFSLPFNFYDTQRPNSKLELWVVGMPRRKRPNFKRRGDGRGDGRDGDAGARGADGAGKAGGNRGDSGYHSGGGRARRESGAPGVLMGFRRQKAHGLASTNEYEDEVGDEGLATALMGLVAEDETKRMREEMEAQLQHMSDISVAQLRVWNSQKKMCARNIDIVNHFESEAKRKLTGGRAREYLLLLPFPLRPSKVVAVRVRLRFLSGTRWIIIENYNGPVPSVADAEHSGQEVAAAANAGAGMAGPRQEYGTRFQSEGHAAGQNTGQYPGKVQIMKGGALSPARNGLDKETETRRQVTDLFLAIQDPERRKASASSLHSLVHLASTNTVARLELSRIMQFATLETRRAVQTAYAKANKGAQLDTAPFEAGGAYNHNPDQDAAEGSEYGARDDDEDGDPDPLGLYDERRKVGEKLTMDDTFEVAPEASSKEKNAQGEAGDAAMDELVGGDFVLDPHQDRAQSTVDAATAVDLRMDGLGIDLADLKKCCDVLYVSLAKIAVAVEMVSEDVRAKLSLGWCQIDNQMFTAYYPTVLQPIVDLHDEAAKAKHLRAQQRLEQGETPTRRLVLPGEKGIEEFDFADPSLFESGILDRFGAPKDYEFLTFKLELRLRSDLTFAQPSQSKLDSFIRFHQKTLGVGVVGVFSDAGDRIGTRPGSPGKLTPVRIEGNGGGEGRGGGREGGRVNVVMEKGGADRGMRSDGTERSVFEAALGAVELPPAITPLVDGTTLVDIPQCAFDFAPLVLNIDLPLITAVLMLLDNAIVLLDSNALSVISGDATEIEQSEMQPYSDAWKTYLGGAECLFESRTFLVKIAMAALDVGDIDLILNVNIGRKGFGAASVGGSSGSGDGAATFARSHSGGRALEYSQYSAEGRSDHDMDRWRDRDSNRDGDRDRDRDSNRDRDRDSDWRDSSPSRSLSQTEALTNYQTSKELHDYNADFSRELESSEALAAGYPRSSPGTPDYPDVSNKQRPWRSGTSQDMQDMDQDRMAGRKGGGSLGDMLAKDRAFRDREMERELFGGDFSEEPQTDLVRAIFSALRLRASMSDAKVSLPAMQYRDLAGASDVVAMEIVSPYFTSAAGQIARVLGAIDLLGNPSLVVRHFLKGCKKAGTEARIGCFGRQRQYQALHPEMEIRQRWLDQPLYACAFSTKHLVVGCASAVLELCSRCFGSWYSVMEALARNHDRYAIHPIESFGQGDITEQSATAVEGLSSGLFGAVRVFAVSLLHTITKPLRGCAAGIAHDGDGRRGANEATLKREADFDTAQNPMANPQYAQGAYLPEEGILEGGNARDRDSGLFLLDGEGVGSGERRGSDLSFVAAAGNFSKHLLFSILSACGSLFCGVPSSLCLFCATTSTGALNSLIKTATVSCMRSRRVFFRANRDRRPTLFHRFDKVFGFWSMIASSPAKFARLLGLSRGKSNVQLVKSVQLVIPLSSADLNGAPVQSALLVGSKKIAFMTKRDVQWYATWDSILSIDFVVVPPQLLVDETAKEESRSRGRPVTTARPKAYIRFIAKKGSGACGIPFPDSTTLHQRASRTAYVIPCSDLNLAWHQYCLVTYFVRRSM